MNPIEPARVKLTGGDVRRVAELANLELRDDEIVKMTHDLDGILTHIDKLKEVDTSNVEPMVSTLNVSSGGVSFAPGPEATLRDDSERATLGTSTAIANAPLSSQSGSGAGYFKVPKVIER